MVKSPIYCCSGVGRLVLLLATLVLCCSCLGGWADVSLYRRPLDSTKPESTATNAQAKIAIIIDDLGYRLSRSKRAINLPGQITVAVIPHSPHAVELANFAAQQGKEVMLHAPMSNLLDKPLDEGALTAAMDHSQFANVLNDNLESVPHVKGLNNHMGSELTQQRQPMQWLMGELKKRDLYFVDSRTSPQSLAWEVAHEANLPALKRDIFLDNDLDPEKIAAQFDQLLTISRERGYAVAIAHPYPETLLFLESVLPTLAQQGYQLVPVSNLLSSLQPQVKTQLSHANQSQD